MKTIQELARFASAQFYQKKRKPDDDNEIYLLDDDAPEWIVTMCHEAHGNMLPDDYRYQFIVEALDAIAGQDDPEEAIAELEPSVYTSDQTAWLHSRNDRSWYVDQAIADIGKADDFNSVTDAIACGMRLEMEEVARLVLNSLEEKLEEDSESEETEETEKSME